MHIQHVTISDSMKPVHCHMLFKYLSIILAIMLCCLWILCDEHRWTSIIPFNNYKSHQLLAKLMYLVKEVKYYDRYISFKNSLRYVKTQVINVAST